MKRFMCAAAVLGIFGLTVSVPDEASAASVVCVKKSTGMMRYLDTAPVIQINKKTKKSTTVVPACDATTEVQLAWNKDGVAGAPRADGNGYGPFSYNIGDTGPGGGIIFFVDRYN